MCALPRFMPKRSPICRKDSWLAKVQSVNSSFTCSGIWDALVTEITGASSWSNCCTNMHKITHQNKGKKILHNMFDLANNMHFLNVIFYFNIAESYIISTHFTLNYFAMIHYNCGTHDNILFSHNPKRYKQQRISREKVVPSVILLVNTIGWNTYNLVKQEFQANNWKMWQCDWEQAYTPPLIFTITVIIITKNVDMHYVQHSSETDSLL